MAVLSGSTPLYVLLLRRIVRRGTGRARRPVGGSSSTRSRRCSIAARRFAAGSSARRNRLFERLIETRLRTPHHLAMVPESVLDGGASSWGLVVVGPSRHLQRSRHCCRRRVVESSFSHRNSTCLRLTVTSPRKLSLRGCRPPPRSRGSSRPRSGAGAPFQTISAEPSGSPVGSAPIVDYSIRGFPFVLCPNSRAVRFRCDGTRTCSGAWRDARISTGPLLAPRRSSARFPC